jgi:hypothetical protein
VVGPYEVQIAFENGVVRIKTLDEEPISFTVNGHRLRIYTKPLSRDEFCQQILQQKEMEMVYSEASSLATSKWQVSIVPKLYICTYINRKE